MKMQNTCNIHFSLRMRFTQSCLDHSSHILTNQNTAIPRPKAIHKMRYVFVPTLEKRVVIKTYILGTTDI